MRVDMTVLLDKSGSMMHMAPIMKLAYDQFMAEQKGYRDQMFVSLYQFNTDGVSTDYERLAVDAVPPLAMFCGSCTPLWDSVGDTIDRVSERIEQAKRDHEAPDKVIFIVFTDGGENDSVRWDSLRVRQAVQARMADNWEFMFFGAGIDAFAEANRMGMKASDTANVGTGKQALERMWSMLNENLRGVRLGEKADMSMTDAQKATLK